MASRIVTFSLDPGAVVRPRHLSEAVWGNQLERFLHYAQRPGLLVEAAARVEALSEELGTEFSSYKRLRTDPRLDLLLRSQCGRLRPGEEPRVRVVAYDGVKAVHPDPDDLPLHASLDQLANVPTVGAEWVYGDARLPAITELAADLRWAKHLVVFDPYLGVSDHKRDVHAEQNLKFLFEWLQRVPSLRTVHLVGQSPKPVLADGWPKTEERISRAARSARPPLRRVRVKWYGPGRLVGQLHRRVMLAYKNLEAPMPLAAWGLDRGIRDLGAEDGAVEGVTGWTMLDPFEMEGVIRRLDDAEPSSGWRLVHTADA